MTQSKSSRSFVLTEAGSKKRAALVFWLKVLSMGIYMLSAMDHRFFNEQNAIVYKPVNFLHSMKISLVNNHSILHLCLICLWYLWKVEELLLVKTIFPFKHKMSYKSKNAYTRFSKSYIKRWQELYTFAEKMFAEVEKYSYLKANTRLKGRKGFRKHHQSHL